MNITINPIVTTTNTTNLSSCKNVIYNGNTYSSSTVLKDTVKSYQGCDSIYNVVNININPIVTTTNTTNLSSCKSIIYNGNTYASSTVLRDTVKSYQGCDSIYNVVNININPIVATTNTASLKSCKSIVYNGNTYASSTVLKDTVKSYQGCDSVYNVVNININPITPTTSTIAVSGCGSVIYKGITYNLSAVLKDTIRTFQGCDSVYTTTNINVISIPSASITYIGNPFFATGVANVTVTTSSVLTSNAYTANPNGLALNSSDGSVNLAASTPGTYQVLYTFGSGGCSDTTSTTITIKPVSTNVYIPNTFTPDGDGVNDVLYVYGTSIVSLKMNVYNQWGELLFTSNSQSQGWDGMAKGKLQPTGVYIYVAQVILQDGTVLNKKGAINLIR